MDEDLILDKEKHIFWLDDPSILYRDGRYMEFIPTSNMTRRHQLNAITRFLIYYLIILIMFRMDTHYLYIPAGGIAFVIVLYYIYMADPQGKQKEIVRERFIESGKNIETGSDSQGEGKEYIVESGYYDSDGKLHLGSNYTAKSRAGNNTTYTPNELLDYQRNVCRKPTRDNPFMNPPITDFNDGFKPSACNADDEDIKEQIQDTYNLDLYRNVEDLYNVKNSQRQFYTIPSKAIPPDQPAFADWLYKSPSTCKENNVACLRFEDIRFKR